MRVGDKVKQMVYIPEWFLFVFILVLLLTFCAIIFGRKIMRLNRKGGELNSLSFSHVIPKSPSFYETLLKVEKKELGLYERYLKKWGTIEVGDLEFKVVEEPPIIPTPTLGERVYYTLHVGSFPDKKSAISFASMLRNKGFIGVYITKAVVFERGITYRVRIGIFTNRGKVEGIKKRFEQEFALPSVVLAINGNYL